MELDDALSPGSPFPQNSHLPVTPGAKFGGFFPKQASDTAQSWILGCHGAAVATPGQRF